MSAGQVVAVPLAVAVGAAEEAVKLARLRAYSIADELGKRPPRGLRKRAKRALLEGELAVLRPPLPSTQG